MEPSDNKVPKHVGIIMDGNRRFAKRLMAKPWKGHEWGAEKLKKVLEWCRDLGVQEATFYAFSIQNFNRPEKEFNYLMKVFEEEAENLLDDDEFLSNDHGVRVNFLGRIEMFPDALEEKMREIMEHTKDNDEYILNMAMGYGGREEVIDAARRIGEQIEKGELDVDEINEEVFSNYLYTADEPDMIIRTGGEKRTSNFLAFQSAYSEWFFVEKMWPEFEKEDFLACIKDYNERERRFGR